MKFNKGFTLIELLVVIAIIGILSSVVLASLTSARTKGTDAAIQSELSNMRAQAELLYSNANSYGPTFAVAACTGAADNSLFGTSSTGSLKNLITSVDAKNGSGAVTCVATGGTAWAVSSPLSSGHFCVDSQGNSIATSSAVTVAACK